MASDWQGGARITRYMKHFLLEEAASRSDFTCSHREGLLVELNQLK